MKRVTAWIITFLIFAGALFAAPRTASASTDDFFSDAVFLGDSLTVGLEKYVKDKRKSDKDYFSDAQFLARVSYAVSHTLQEDGYSMHPAYEGDLLQPQKSLKRMKAKKVFITLGVNDIGANKSTIVSNYQKLLKAIKEELPKASLYLLAVFPMTERKETSKRSNKAIDSLNKDLLSLSVKNDVTFVDITPALKSDGALDKAYSSDDYVHLNSDGYAVWTKQLYAFAAFMQKTASASAGKASIVNVSDYVNARSGPGTNHDKVATIKKGASVTIKENAGNNWYLVEYSGKSLYVYGKYLSTVGSGIRGTIENVSEYVNLRRGPSTGYDVCGKVKKGREVAVSKEYYSPDWYRCTYDGDTGYIAAKYLSIP